MWSRILLWLFTINLGIALGAGLYEARIAVPDWLGVAPDGVAHWNADAARRHDTGLRFWGFVTTAPLTLLTLANLVAARRTSGALRRWWLAAGLAALCDRVFTFAYFIPTMVWLMRQPDTLAAVLTATIWADLNYVRLAILLTAWICALRAFALVHQNQNRGQA
jgi:hypothetical protein